MSEIVGSAEGRSGRRVVVVGDGMVGRRFTEALRSRETDCRVTVLAEEKRPAYDRVRLSAYFDGVSAEELSLGEADPGVDLRLSQPVRRIDTAAKNVHTDHGCHPYDELVLATGSYAFVPPIPGVDSTGCFVYRTLDDLEALREHARDRKHGTVVGGGLLGLEAANALRLLGLDVTVVEFAPHLMPAQLDAAGGGVLRDHIAALGIDIRCGTAISEVAPGERLTVAAGDGESIETDVVVFAAGVRPRDELARAAGLAVGDRGGVLVDETCRSSDPAIWAVGECAAMLGQCHGLVAPGYAMAEVAADRIAGGAAVFPGADTATKLKLLGVDVATFGELASRTGKPSGELASRTGRPSGELATRTGRPSGERGSRTSAPSGELATRSGKPTGELASRGAGSGREAAPRPTATDDTAEPLSATYFDPVDGVYAKLLLSDDARTLLGGILVGDAEAYPALRASVGGPLPGRLADLLSNNSGGDTELPATAQICSCNAVAKADITDAIATGCQDVASLKECTKAGTTCGSCVPLLKRLLTESGVAQSKALCEHFGHSRAELFDIIRVRGITTFSALIAEHGTGRGCDICKPVVASILASLANGHILDDEQATLQDTNDHFLANLQRNGSYSVVPRVPGGEITPQKLIVIGEIARDFQLYTKITGAQRIDMLGARVEQLPLIWRRLVDAGFESGHAYGKSLRTVKSCVGTTWCRYGVQDSVSLAIELELRYRGLRSPHKIKSAVSGCARECAEARGKDFGIIATETGWNLYVGGNGGFTPKHAQLFLSDLDTDNLVRYIDRFLMFYVRTADRLQRTSAWLEALEGGLDYLKEVIVADSLGICAELDAAMARHVASYEDEWAGVLSDPVKLRRFVSFVNAPEAPDESIRFTREREQLVPLGMPEVRS